jgi:hypothetical protein
VKQLKIILYLFLFPIIASDIYLIFFYNFEVYSFEFFIISTVINGCLCAVIFGLLKIYGIGNTDKNLPRLFLFLFCFEVFISIFDYYRNKKDLDESQAFTIGYVVGKNHHKGGMDVIYYFDYQDKSFRSKYPVESVENYDDYSIGDSAIIRFSKRHPKNNEVTKIYCHNQKLKSKRK